MFNPIESVFTEKYRPKLISEMVGDFKLKILKHLKNPKSIENFLFYSTSPGTGKSTCAKAIINELGCDSLVINSSDDRKIDVIRDKVKEFVRGKSSKEGVKRAVFLDEFDGCTLIAQNALRNLMETYADNSFYLITANALNRVIEYIQSRCIVIPFTYPNRDEIYKYLAIICKKENMGYTEEGLKKLIELNYPNIRNCVIALQDLKVEDKRVIPENIAAVDELFDELWTLVEQKKWKEIKEKVLQNIVNPIELNTHFWKKCLSKSNMRGLQITCRNERDFAAGADPKVIFVTSIIELCK